MFLYREPWTEKAESAEQEHNLSFTLIALTLKSSCFQKRISESTFETDYVFDSNLDIKSTFTCY